MPSYIVRWVIDLDAPSPVEAAAMAREIQQDLNSTATLFAVFEAPYVEGMEPTMIDLLGEKVERDRRDH